jgi:hypothetical protein
MRRGLAAVGALEIVVVDERPAPGGLDKEAGGPVTARGGTPSTSQTSIVGRICAYFATPPRRSQSMTTVEGRATDARVTDCPAKDCDGRALITYATHRFRSPAVRIIAEIACDREGCEYFAATETVEAARGDDPRGERVRALRLQ